MTAAGVLALQIAAEFVARDSFFSPAARTVLEPQPGRLSYLWFYDLLLG